MKMIEIGKQYDPIELFKCNGNPEEIIGSKAGEPNWKNIIDIGVSTKYDGTTQSIPLNTISTTISFPIEFDN